MTLDGLNRDDPIPLLEASRLFAERDMRKGDDVRSAEDRARKFIKEAVKKGALPSPDDGKTFPLADFVGWARSLTRNGESWDDKFKGFPANIKLSFTVAAPVMTAGFSMLAQIVTPATDAPQEWVNALEKANRKWADAQRENEILLAEIERLRPLAERQEEIRAKAQKAAKMPRPRTVEK